MSLCGHCRNSGLVVAHRSEPDGRHTEWAKPCSCPIGQAQSERRFTGAEGQRAFGVGPYWQGHPGLADAAARSDSPKPFTDQRAALAAKLSEDL